MAAEAGFFLVGSSSELLSESDELADAPGFLAGALDEVGAMDF